ncbi:MAG: leucine-rich repeat protein [Oscillospiraceae bacterium]|nr:leucine-rich repeat protein [Oscillospiraceae bacterium]
MQFKRLRAGFCAAGLALSGTSAVMPDSGLKANAYVVQIDGEYNYAINDDNESSTFLSYTGESEHLIIPETLGGLPVTNIADHLWGKEIYIDVTIPDTVTTIGESAFGSFKLITSITVPDSVTVMKMNVFSGCLALKSVTLSKNITKIPNGTFSRCESLSGIIIPDGVTEIGQSAFADCSSLTGITIPEGVTKIGTFAFYNSGLTNIIIPESVQEIGAAAFKHCNENLTIYGYSGSYAESYANSKGIPFVALSEQPANKTGDLTGDGEIGADDAQMTLKAYVNILADKDSGLTEIQLKVADVDGDGAVTATDAQMILKYYVNTLAGKEVTWDDLLPKK